jgi:uncharacterized protein YbaP (TraB family)
MKMCRIAFVCVVAALATVSFAAVKEKKEAVKKAGNDKSFCWKVTKGNNTLYLLGSVHLGTPDMVPLAKNVEDAFDASSYLFVELDPSKVDQASMMQKLMYTPPDSITNHISAKTYAAILDFFKQYGTPEAAIVQLKPGAIAMMIELLKLTEMGYNPQFGIDMYFLEKAKDKKKVLELETIDQQLSLIDGLGEQYLIYTLDEVSKSKEEFTKLIQSWKDGDAKTMNAILTKTLKKAPELKPFYQKFIFDRNKTMAAKFQKCLRRKGTYFGIVGAAHLVGKDGIIDILKKSGKYKIEQM